MRQFSLLRVLLFFLWSACVLPAWAQGTSPKSLEAGVSKPALASHAALVEDIASAGRWRLQTQRLSKLYLQAGLGLNAEAARRQIQAAIGQSNTDTQRLEKYGKKFRSYERCGMLWQELRLAAQLPYSRAGVERINQLAEELTLHTGKLAMQIEGESDAPTSRLLDLSSRLNMLAQRLARLYLLAVSGDKSDGRLVDIEQTRKEFLTGMQELESAPENTQASREALALAKNQWIFFDIALRQVQERGDSKAPLHVSTSSERILEALDVVSNQYAQSSPVKGGRATP